MSKVDRFFTWVCNLKTVAHCVMVCFALASLGNVKAFLEEAGHTPSTALWFLPDPALAMAAALGTGLVIVSILLTNIDWRIDLTAFVSLAIAGLGLGALSGSLQMVEYSKHLPLHWAIVLGYGGPLLGEVVLAVAVSMYDKAKDRERFRNVSISIEHAVADRLDVAIAEMEQAAIKRHVERTVNTLARLAVDSVATQAAQFYTRAEVDITPTPVQVDTDVTPEPLNTGEFNELLEDGRNKANEQKRTKATQRQDTLLNILRTEYNGASADALNKTALGTRLGVTRQTVDRDLDALEAANRLVLNGHVEVTESHYR